MAKKTILLILLAWASLPMHGQGILGRVIAFGADRDTLKYIIASPFDNWWLNMGGGLQTFIGNEVESSARHNKLDFNVRAEIGKWIIPDLAVSLRLSYMTVHGQSRYPLQPFIDFTGLPRDADGNLPYQPFSAHAATAMGFVTIDWTNFFRGYEAGRNRRFHIYTPIGLGASMLFGTQKNPQNKAGDVGDFRRNFELAFAFDLGAEYIISRELSVNASLELFGSESTWDWSPYDNKRTIFDLIPSVNVGVKINLLKQITKYDVATHSSKKSKVYHEFLAFGSSHTVSDLHDRIDRLVREKDSIQDLSNQQQDEQQQHLDSINRALGDLQNLLAQAQDDLEAQRRPLNIFEELTLANEALNLPACIVYFELDKYNLDYNACRRLEAFCKEARQSDDTVQYYIIGAADSLTGSIRHNQWLSERRSEAALNHMVERLDMDAARFVRVSVGGITEYNVKEDNRMAMIIQKTPITEEIVRRWIERSKQNIRGAKPDRRDRNGRVSDGYSD